MLISNFRIVCNECESSRGLGTVNKVRTKVRIMSKGVEFGKMKLVAKFVTI